MNKELEDKFYKRFKFFDKKHLYDFSVGDGWFDLLWQLCLDLEEMGFDGYINQIKEKFSSLRFYVDGANSEQWNRIEKAENDSEEICELCGKVGKMRKTGWIKTLCEECFKKWKEKRE